MSNVNDTKNSKPINTDYLAMLSHDLKTPIYAQIRALNLLYSGMFGEFSKDAKNLILNVIASNKYMQSLVDNVLFEYKMKKENFKSDIKKCDFRKTLEECIQSVGILSEVNGQKILVNYECNNYIKIYNEIEIKRVIINFLSNAFKYSKENSPIIIKIKTNSNSLVFKIKSEVATYLNSNEELDKKRKYGFGLGLIICEKIIKKHNGTFLKGNIENGFFKIGFTLP